MIKRLVQEIKKLGYEYAASLGDPIFLRKIERAMADEEATVQKRFAARRRTVRNWSGGVVRPDSHASICSVSFFDPPTPRFPPCTRR